VTMLPEEFADVERFAERWCLASEPERYAERLAASMDDLRDFYDAVRPRMAAIVDYCDGFRLAEMPEDARNLMHLAYSWINVSFPIEVWDKPRVPDSGSARFDCFVEPQP